MSPTERDYYRIRAEHERARAAEATSPVAGEIHEELACLYEKLVELEDQNPGLRVAKLERLSA
jgi:hypothetical protein